jgi:hypothetical protein
MKVAGVLAAGLAAALLAGCRVESDKHGDSDNVTISTPFGGMQVKTNDAATAEGLGMPVYPGAQLLKKDKDDESADVEMSFGNFQMRVKTVSYRTGDSTGKVEAFYRSGLRRFGDVIACRDNRPVGAPARTQEGLTCDNSDDKQSHNSVDDRPDKGALELKAGSRQHQHIVAVQAEGGGTKIELVALDLPDKNSSDNDEDQDRQ